MNVDALYAKMGERRFSISKLAKASGVNRNTMSYYLKHPEKFPYPIMESIATELRMNIEEAREIFFASKLA